MINITETNKTKMTEDDKVICNKKVIILNAPLAPTVKNIFQWGIVIKKAQNAPRILISILLSKLNALNNALNNVLNRGDKNELRTKKIKTK